MLSLQIGATRVHFVRTRGGNRKFRALRLDAGNFAWASEGMARKCRIIDVVYNASNNELIRTKTLVKNAIIVIDAAPFRQWYESHYLLPLGKKREVKAGEEDVISKQRSKHAMKKFIKRQKTAKLEPALEEQFNSGRLLGKLFPELPNVSQWTEMHKRKCIGFWPWCRSSAEMMILKLRLTFIASA